MTEYYRITEHNDHEGETWLVYFKATEEIMEVLEEAFAAYDPILSMDGPYTQEQVDFIISETQGIGGYSALASIGEINKKVYGKIVDLLAHHEDTESDEFIEELENLVYKGGLFR